METPLKLLALTKYGRLGASSRLRFFQYFPELLGSGFSVVGDSLISDELLSERYRSGRYGVGPLLNAYVHRLGMLRKCGQFDLLWIEAEALPWFPATLELLLLRKVPFVLDYDDALFHNYDQHRLPMVRHVFGHRLDKLMAKAALVVGGNPYLAKRAQNAGATWVERLPTVIDLERYSNPAISNRELSRSKPPDEPLRMVWIGSPATVHYLRVILKPLQDLAQRHRFVLRIIGGGEIELPGLTVEQRAWSESTEVADIRASQIGLMPLIDSKWEQGKCGYKLIQYMACGLPVVASAVGVNAEIVGDGQAGFIAAGDKAWQAALEKLVLSSDLRATMGATGRRKVEEQCCIQKTAPRLAGLLRKAARNK